MGTILKGRFSFTTLQGIRDAYAAAFSVDEEKVNLAVKDRALFRISCVRNVIVHRAGIADEECCKKMKDESFFSHIKKGEQVQLNGEIVTSLINSTTQCGAVLVMAVDEWLDSHREP